MKLLRLVLTQCYFVWEGTLYRQISGLPMGGQLSPIIANIYMEDLEFRVLSTSLTTPKLYLHYVDEIYIIWSLKNGDFAPFLDSLNSVHPDIQLTVEEETD